MHSIKNEHFLYHLVFFDADASDSKSRRKFDEEQEQKFIVRTVPDVLELGNVSSKFISNSL